MDGKTYTANNEGCRLVAYEDTLGYWTIGRGHKLGKGPGFEGMTWTQTQCDAQYSADYALAEEGAEDDLGETWQALDEIRRAVLIDMSFNLGENGLAQFHRMLDSIIQKDWQTASAELLASEYARQVPNRAKRNAEILATGAWPDEAMV